MNRTLIGAFVIIVVAALLVCGAIYWIAGEYRQTRCDVAATDDNVSAIYFANGLDQHQSITFINDVRLSVLGVKTAIDWDRIAAFRSRPYASEPNLLRLSIQFKQNDKTFDIGLVERACYARIRERHGHLLKFIDEQ